MTSPLLIRHLTSYAAVPESVAALLASTAVPENYDTTCAPCEQARREAVARLATFAPAPTTDTDAAPPTATWHGVIAVEGELTGDGRFIQPDALRWEDLPIPLRFVSADTGAHHGAVVVGHVNTISRDDDGTINATGDFDLGSDAGREAARLVGNELMQGVSMDLDDVAFEVRVAADAAALTNLDPTELTTAKPGPDGRVVAQTMEPDDEVMVTTSARIRASTIVAVPAFSRAKIHLDDPSVLSLTASLGEVPPDLLTAMSRLVESIDPDLMDFNWVEDVGGLPKYIRRIADHLQEKGMVEGHAIATAVNVVKKMCATGDLNFPGKQNVNPKSRAEACAAVTEWEEKKARAHLDVGLTTPYREVSTKERARLEEKGHAMPGGAYPIANCQDLRNAIRAIGRAKDRAGVIKHIQKRARALKREGKCKDVTLPEHWALDDDDPFDDDPDLSLHWQAGGDKAIGLAQPATGDKQWDPADHFRVPPGNPQGGQFAPSPHKHLKQFFGDYERIQKAWDAKPDDQRYLKWKPERDRMRQLVAHLGNVNDRMKNEQPGSPEYRASVQRSLDLLGNMDRLFDKYGQHFHDYLRDAMKQVIRPAMKNLRDFMSIDFEAQADADFLKGLRPATAASAQVRTHTLRRQRTQQFAATDDEWRDPRTGKWIDTPAKTLREFLDVVEADSGGSLGGGGPLFNDMNRVTGMEALDPRMPDAIKDIKTHLDDLRSGVEGDADVEANYPGGVGKFQADIDGVKAVLDDFMDARDKGLDKKFLDAKDAEDQAFLGTTPDMTAPAVPSPSDDPSSPNYISVDQVYGGYRVSVNNTATGSKLFKNEAQANKYADQVRASRAEADAQGLAGYQVTGHYSDGASVPLAGTYPSKMEADEAAKQLQKTTIRSSTGRVTVTKTDVTGVPKDPADAEARARAMEPSTTSALPGGWTPAATDPTRSSMATPDGGSLDVRETADGWEWRRRDPDGNVVDSGSAMTPDAARQAAEQSLSSPMQQARTQAAAERAGQAPPSVSPPPHTPTPQDLDNAQHGDLGGYLDGNWDYTDPDTSDEITLSTPDGQSGSVRALDSGTMDPADTVFAASVNGAPIGTFDDPQDAKAAVEQVISSGQLRGVTPAPIPPGPEPPLETPPSGPLGLGPMVAPEFPQVLVDAEDLADRVTSDPGVPTTDAGEVASIINSGAIPGGGPALAQALRDWMDRVDLSRFPSDWVDDLHALIERLEGSEGAYALTAGGATMTTTDPDTTDLPRHEFFTDPHLSGPTPLTVTQDGRVYGHLATWGTCHISHSQGGRCVDPPRSASRYAYFLTGSVLTDDGAEIPTGRITMGTGHALDRASATQALSHYDDTGTAIADVTAGEDRFGIWVSGQVRPTATTEQIRTLRASPLSGDWRRIAGSLELVAALAVNVPGFPIPRPKGMVASGSMTSLVAAGMLPPRKVRRPGTSNALSLDDLRYLKRLAARERADEDERRVHTLDKARALAIRLRASALAARLNQ